MNIETKFNIGDIIQHTDKTTGVVIQMKVEKITATVFDDLRPTVWYYGGYYYADKNSYQFAFSTNAHDHLTKVEDK